MLKLSRKEYDITLDNTFPVYWKATDEQLEKAVYDWEDWLCTGDYDNWYIVSFEEIKADFDSWTDEERMEYLQDGFEEWQNGQYTVYNWIRDCMMNVLAVISGYKRKGEQNND